MHEGRTSVSCSDQYDDRDEVYSVLPRENVSLPRTAASAVH